MDIIQFNEIVKLQGLAEVIDHRDKRNPSGNLPYHGNKHMNFMLSDCLNSYLYYQVWERGNQPIIEYSAIFYAAIFHDVDHSGGLLTDDLNVDNAIEAWRTFVDSPTSNTCISEAHTYHGKMVRLMVPVLIRATQYPYIEITESQEYREYVEADMHYHASVLDACYVLRDADLMSIYHGDIGFELVNQGLYEEMSSEDSIYGPMTYDVFIEKETEFLHNVKWFTLWGKRRAVVMDYPKLVQDLLADAENYLFGYAMKKMYLEMKKHTEEQCKKKRNKGIRRERK